MNLNAFHSLRSIVFGSMRSAAPELTNPFDCWKPPAHDLSMRHTLRREHTRAFSESIPDSTSTAPHLAHLHTHSVHTRLGTWPDAHTDGDHFASGSSQGGRADVRQLSAALGSV